MTMRELNDASNIIYEESGEDANVILGCVIDPELSDEIRITVISTGLNNKEDQPTININKDIDFSEKYSKHSTNIEETKISDLANNKNKINETNIKLESKEEKSKLTFGDDDLDVPTFLRSRKF